MAEVTIKKPNNREIKYFDVAVPSGSASYIFTSSVPSDYLAANRLTAISIGGAGLIITQLGAYALYFKEALGAASLIRILYYGD